MTDDRMSPQDLADYLGVPLSSIYKWNSEHSGPKYFKAGRHVRYRRADVLAWETSRLVEQTAVSRPA